MSIFHLRTINQACNRFRIVSQTRRSQVSLIFLLFGSKFTITLRIRRHYRLLLRSNDNTASDLFKVRDTINFRIRSRFIRINTLLSANIFRRMKSAASQTRQYIRLRATSTTTFIFITLAYVNELMTATADCLRLRIRHTIIYRINSGIIAISSLGVIVRLGVNDDRGAQTLLDRNRHRFVAAIRLSNRAFRIRRSLSCVFLRAFSHQMLIRCTISLNLSRYTTERKKRRSTARHITRNIAGAALRELRHSLNTNLASRLRVSITKNRRLVCQALRKYACFLTLA